MTTPFDAIAPQYHRLWSGTDAGKRQRVEVWRELGRLFRAGDVILDLGCGTGDDAVHLRVLGVRVVGIDSSRQMVRIARDRGVDARHLLIEDISALEGPFDGAISNFGALNCVPDLAAVARELGRLVRPEGPIALCFMTRVSLRETAACLLKLQFRKAVRRWSGRATWRGINVFYPRASEIRTAFEPWFRFVRRARIGGGDHALYVFQRRSLC
jgi:ubiquinone/menaquinone biosynthesis C-methylase UbiE